MQGKNKHFPKKKPGRIRTTKHLTTYLPGIHHRPVITVSTGLTSSRIFKKLFRCDINIHKIRLKNKHFSRHFSKRFKRPPSPYFFPGGTRCRPWIFFQSWGGFLPSWGLSQYSPPSRILSSSQRSSSWDSISLPFCSLLILVSARFIPAT